MESVSTGIVLYPSCSHRNRLLELSTPRLALRIAHHHLLYTSANLMDLARHGASTLATVAIALLIFLTVCTLHNSIHASKQLDMD